MKRNKAALKYALKKYLKNKKVQKKRKKELDDNRLEELRKIFQSLSLNLPSARINFYEFPIQLFNVKVRIDKYGKIVPPKEIRHTFNIHENSELTLSVKENEIVIRVQRGDLEEKVVYLIELLKNNAPKAFVSEVEEDEKWLTKEYGFEKIGLNK